MIPVQDFSVKYGGRGFSFTVIVNTDEEMETIIGRLTTAAGGPAQNAVIVAAKKLSPAEMETTFKVAQAVTYQASGTPFRRTS